MNTKQLQVGLMGCGAVANYGHIPAIQEVEGMELCSIFDPNTETLAHTQSKFKIPNAYSDVDEFFASGVEAIVVTSPAPFHRDNVLMAAKHKLPVLCEKPLATNKEEASEMIAAMKTAGVSLYNALCYRFNESALKTKELVRQKAIGEVRSLRLIYNWNLHGKYTLDADGNKIIQQRREGRMLEGGPMVDCGVHKIDLAMFWLGSDVVDFSAHGAWVENYEAPDHMWLHMNHANGAHTMVEMSFSYCHTSKNNRAEYIHELIGTEGVIRYDRTTETFIMENVDGTTEYDFARGKNFNRMYEEWLTALETGKTQLLASAEEGMRTVEIARSATDAVIKTRI